MDLKCFLYPGWEPRIRPSSTHRTWMDDAPERFPYRCLPLAIANSHGWEVLSPCGFEAEWNGGAGADDVTVRCDPGTPEQDRPVALFGLGTFTIHIQGLLRTPPGWNLYVGGPPNEFKDGVAPLAGMIETDWSPYTFTMNWKLTRPDNPVRFDENEPVAFFFPVPRGAAEAMTPRFESIAHDPELKDAFEAWSRSRDAFQREVTETPSTTPTAKWQKFYYRGLMPDGRCPLPAHQSKLQVKAFDQSTLTGGAVLAMAKPVTKRAVSTFPSLVTTLAKRDWLLRARREHRALSIEVNGIVRREGVGSEEFLDQFYALGRPVVLGGEIDDWPARSRWTSRYLRDTVGRSKVTLQDQRTEDPDFERYKDNHVRTCRFDHFIDRIVREGGNTAYLTAYNACANAAALAPLDADVGRLAKFLDHADKPHGGMMWIGPAGTFTPLHHDLTNNLLVQVMGRKRVVMAAADEVAELYNDHHVFSQIRDVTHPDLDFGAYPRLENVIFYDIELEPGDALFIPLGWWHQVASLDFSVSMTFPNFRWRNDWYARYPE